jgi:glycerol uptake facilitator-like aquaporin
MESYGLARRLAAEALGTAFLVAAVVGSGIMADRLTGDQALALLCNTIATGAILVVIITIFGPISAAHFNPAVTLAFRLRGNIANAEAACYAVAQVAGGILGAWAAHLMFEEPLLQLGAVARTGAGQWFAEGVAAFGLVGTIFAALRFRPDAVAWLVGLYITSAYWFTASTSFANPAVAIARGLTASFSGIRPLDVPAFIFAELLGATLAAFVFAWLLRHRPIECPGPPSAPPV